MQLTHTVWNQIPDNEWINYVPRRDSITILFANRDPVDVPLKGAGRLSMTLLARVTVELHFAPRTGNQVKSVKR